MPRPSHKNPQSKIIHKYISGSASHVSCPLERGTDPYWEESLANPVLPKPHHRVRVAGGGAHPQPWLQHHILPQVNAAAEFPPGQKLWPQLGLRSKPGKGRCQQSNRKTSSCDFPCDGSSTSREQGAERTEQQHGEASRAQRNQSGCLSSLVAEVPNISNNVLLEVFVLNVPNQCLNTMIQLSVSEHATVWGGGFTF